MSEARITGERLRAARALLGWRQSDLAGAAGLHERAVQQIEAGTRRGRPETHARLRAALEAAGVRFTAGGVSLAKGARRRGAE